MSLDRVKNTTHGDERSGQRMNMPKRQREKLIKDASRYGKKWQNMEPGPLQDYVRTKGEYKRVKHFCGYIFIFQKNSTSLITMYPVPTEILAAQKTFELKGVDINETNS